MHSLPPSPLFSQLAGGVCLRRRQRIGTHTHTRRERKKIYYYARYLLPAAEGGRNRCVVLSFLPLLLLYLLLRVTGENLELDNG